MIELILPWLRQNREVLAIKVVGYEWPKILGIPYFDCSVECTIDGVKIVGSATGATEELALIKAVAELTERAVFIKTKSLTSNGFAAHKTELQSTAAARFELLERDALLYHYFKQMNPKLIAAESLLSEAAVCTMRFFNKGGVKVFIGELQCASDGTHAVVTVGVGLSANRPFGLCVGLGCSSHLGEAAEKSAWECYRHLIPAVTKQDECKKMSIADFYAVSRPGPLEHLALCLDLEFAQRTLEWLMPISGGYAEKRKTCRLSFSEEKVTVPEPFDRLPFVVTQTNCSSLIPLFFGPTTEYCIRKGENRAISHKEIGCEFQFDLGDQRWEKIKALPHPLG